MRILSTAFSCVGSMGFSRMCPDLPRWYAVFSGAFLMLQGVSTLAARWIPAVDQAFPQLLATTRMVPAHSLLHIASALVALLALRAGSSAVWWFTGGFGLFYLALGAAGWASGRELCLGLQAFDHPFHVLLGALGLASATAATARSRSVAR